VEEMAWIFWLGARCFCELSAAPVFSEVRPPAVFVRAKGENSCEG